MNAEEKQAIRESLEIILFELQIGKEVHFTPQYGINMAQLLTALDAAEREVERLKRKIMELQVENRSLLTFTRRSKRNG